MSERRISARGVIFKDGKILAQQPQKDGVPYDFWCTMGGGMDPGESIVDCLQREMIEETGITPKIGRLLYVQQFIDAKEREIMDFFFEVMNVDDYEHIDLAATTHGELETAKFGFVDPSAVNLMPLFLRTRDIAADLAGTTQVVILDNLHENGK